MSTLIDYISGNEVKATPEEVEAVQPFVKRLVEDFGYPKHLISTHPQHRVSRSPSDETQSYPIDIAVFTDAQKRSDQLHMVVECKQKKRKDGVKQLKRHLDLCEATIGVWYNGHAHFYARKFVNDRAVNDYEELPTLPRYGQRVEDIGKFLRKDLQPTLNLGPIFRDLRNFIAGNATGITRDETIAGEIINLLFCKIDDELNTAPNEALDFRHGVGEPASNVAERTRRLFATVKQDYADAFDADDRMRLDDKCIAYVVGELQPYCVTEAERDIVGEAFEVFIGPALKGSQGQFFTPRNIVRTAIHIVDPSQDDVILDPACGSGGFLIVALEHVWDKISTEAKRRGLGKHWQRRQEDSFAQSNVLGIEKDSFLAKITKAYMAIVGDGRGGIFCENSLLRSDSWCHQAHKRITEGKIDVIATNPPFGSKITISDEETLREFELGHKWKRDRTKRAWTKTDKVLPRQAPQILFVERCHQLLRPGGTLAIVLPDGILGGTKIGYVPTWIKSKFDVIAAVDCPMEAFSPNTTTKVHLLVLRKKGKGKAVKHVFMSVTQTIGHDKKGDPVMRPSKPKEVWDDMEDTKKHWRQFRAGKLKDSPLGFSIVRDELEESLNAKRYLPDFMEVLRVVRRTRRTKYTIKEIASKLSTGANVDNLDYVSDAADGVPYILVKNVLAEGITFSNLKYISKSAAAASVTSIVRPGDIIINRCGDAGIAVIVPDDYAGAIACGFCFILRVKKPHVPNGTAVGNFRFGRHLRFLERRA